MSKSSTPSQRPLATELARRLLAVACDCMYHFSACLALPSSRSLRNEKAAAGLTA